LRASGRPLPRDDGGRALAPRRQHRRELGAGDSQGRDRTLHRALPQGRRGIWTPRRRNGRGLARRALSVRRSSTRSAWSQPGGWCRLPAWLRMDDQRFLAAFEAAAIPRERWAHRDHVRVAFLYLRDHPFEEALSRIRSGIQSLNRANRVPETATSG